MELFYLDGELVLTDDKARKTFQGISASGVIPEDLHQEATPTPLQAPEALAHQEKPTDSAEGQLSLF
jgi:hypothetical protein